MAELNRNQLVQHLLQLGVQFPRGAHIDALRSLYEGHVNANVAGNELNDAGVNRAEGANNINVLANENAAGNNLELADEEAALDAELRILQKRQRIAELRRALAEQGDYDTPSVLSQSSQPTFTDIQHSVSAFSGSDSYDANKWLSDFERTCVSVNGDDNFMLKSVRRLMKPDSDAELFLRTDSSATYSEFRMHFLKTFGHNYSVSEIIEKLNNTKFRPSEMSVMGYILRMQEIALRAQIDEKLTVRCIIDGFRDKTVNVAALYPAQNLEQLKDLARSYQHYREQSASSVTSSVPSTAKTWTAAGSGAHLPTSP